MMTDSPKSVASGVQRDGIYVFGNVLGCLAILLGVLAVLIAFIPVFGVAAIPMAIVGGLFGLVGVLMLFFGRRGLPVLPGIGMATCLLAVVICVTVNILFVKAATAENESNASADSAPGNTASGSISADERKAIELIKADIAEHFVQGPDGWTTQHQELDFSGKVIEGKEPDPLFTQWRKAEVIGARTTERPSGRDGAPHRYIEVDIEIGEKRYYTRKSYVNYTTITNAAYAWDEWGAPNPPGKAATITLSLDINLVRSGGDGNKFGSRLAPFSFKPTKPVPR